MAANTIELIPTKQTSSAGWVSWHKALKTRYGLKAANTLFMKAWDLRAGTGSDASTNELRTYMKDNGVIIDTTTLEDVVDSTSSGLDFMGDFFTVGKYMTLAVGLIVVGGLGLLVFNIVESPLKSAGAAANFTPAGRATKLLRTYPD